MATGELQPVYITSAIEGQPAFRFDGTKHLNATGAFPATVNDYSVFIVFRTSGTGNGTYLFGGSDVASDKWLALKAYTTPRLVFESCEAGSGGNATINADWFNGDPMLASVVNDSGTIDFYRNGVFGGQTTTTCAYELPSPISIAAFYYPPVTYWGIYTGDIAEMVVYSRPLNSAERAQLTAYFFNKYSI